MNRFWGLMLFFTLIPALAVTYVYPPYRAYITYPENGSYVEQAAMNVIGEANHDSYELWLETKEVGADCSDLWFAWAFEQDACPIWDNSTNRNHGLCSYAGFGDHGSPTGSAITVNETLSTNITTDTFNWGLSFWVKTNNKPGTIFSRWDNVSHHGWRLVKIKNYLVIDVYVSDGSVESFSIPANLLDWTHLTVDMVGGRSLYVWRGGALLGVFELSKLYAPSGRGLAVWDSYEGALDLETCLDEVFYYKRAIGKNERLSLAGETENTTITLYNLKPNSTYWARACGKEYPYGGWSCTRSYFTTNTSLGPGRPPSYPVFEIIGNVSVDDAPQVSLFGTPTGWSTGDTTPEILFHISDDGAANFTCNLTIDGSNCGSTNLTTIYGSIESSCSLSEGAHLVAVSCTDDGGNTGSSPVESLSVYPATYNVSFEIAAYDNQTSDPLSGYVVATDEGGRTLVFSKFEESYSTKFPLVLGGYYDYDVFSLSYLPYSERVEPVADTDEDIYLTRSNGTGGFPNSTELNCSQLNIGEKYEIEYSGDMCSFLMWRCNSNNFPASCQLVGFRSLYGAGQLFFEINSWGYYGDTVVLQSSCEPSIKCFEVIEPAFASPNIVVSLARNPQYVVMVLIVIAVGLMASGVIV